jgi:hypothetical protein
MNKVKAAPKPLKNPVELIARKTGDWWQDERRKWCAYCGRQMRHRKGPSPAATGATRDHVLPRAHDGGFVTARHHSRSWPVMEKTGALRKDE